MKGLNTYCFTLLLNTFFKNSMRSEFFEVSVDYQPNTGCSKKSFAPFVWLLRRSCTYYSPVFGTVSLDRLQGRPCFTQSDKWFTY